MAPLLTRVTATLANAAEHRSIFGQYAQTPIYHKPVTVEAPLDDLQGQSVSLSDFRGQAVFLDFWGSWCDPCIKAAPHLEEIKQQTRDQKVVFLNISLDSSVDEWCQAVDEHGLTGVHVHAPGGWQSAVAQLYQVSGIPSYFLVGPAGRLDGRVSHVSDVEEVVSRIEKVASGKVPSSSPKSIRSEMIIRG